MSINLEYLERVKENLEKHKQQWGIAKVTFGCTGDGIFPNYQIFGHDKFEAVTYKGNNHKEDSQNDLYESKNLTQQCFFREDLDSANAPAEIKRAMEVPGFVFEPTSSDINGPESAGRRETKISRIIRDSRLSSQLKIKYGHKCQICGESLTIKHGQYSEAHHIMPLGNPHNGPDIEANMICVCPNHHALLDFLGIKLNRSRLMLEHNIGQEYIDYHNQLVEKNDFS